MKKMKIILFPVALLFFFNAYGECIYNIKTNKDLVLSNICVFKNTVLFKIENVDLKEWYNPLTYFRAHRIYRYTGEIQKSFKGNLSGNFCFIEWREGGFDTIYEMEGVEFLVSFNSNKKCAVIEVGGIIQANNESLTAVQSYNIQLNQ